MIKRRLGIALCQIVSLSFSCAMTTSGAMQKLNDFGYGFKDGLLYQYDKKTSNLSDKRFEFNIHAEHSKNQKHYEALGEIITEYVYDLLLENSMHRLRIPLDAKPEDSHSFLFSSKEKLESPKKLLVLIHGSGVVRAGQWARSLIINHSVDSGTQIPYIEEGRKRDFEILSLNTNENRDSTGNKLPYSDSPTTHAKYVWDNIILPANPDSVAIVAHSYGGHVTMWLARQYPEFFREKVFAVAFTDSVENTPPETVREQMTKMTVNWAASDKPLDTILRSASKSSVEFRSAAHVKHEFTTYSSQKAVFEFIDKRYKEFTTTETPPPEEAVAKKAKLDKEL